MDCLLMTAPLRHGHDTCQRIQRVLGVTVTAVRVQSLKEKHPFFYRL